MNSCLLVPFLYIHFGMIYAQLPNSSMKVLYNHLFVDNSYNNKVRPQVNWTDTTMVNTSLAVVNLIGYDEVTETLSLTGKLTIEWTDQYLKWDPLKFDGLNYLNIPQTDIWRPDVTLENTVTSYVDLGSPSMFILVDYTGHVTWKPMAELHSSCIANVRQFPLDIQNCLLKFEVWSHPTDAVMLRVTHDSVQLHGYNGLPEWEIVQTHADILLVDGDVYAGFSISLKRKPLYLFINVILPIAVISFLGQCVFLLPMESGEKASFSVTVLLSLAVFLTIVSQNLPKTSDSVSIFNVFVFTQVLFCTLNTAITLFQLRLFHMKDDAIVPICIQKMVSLQLRSCYKCKSNHVQSNSTNHDESQGTTNTALPVMDGKDSFILEEGNHERVGTFPPVITWRRVAVWMDLRAFLVCFILNVIVTMCLLII